MNMAPDAFQMLGIAVMALSFSALAKPPSAAARRTADMSAFAYQGRVPGQR